MAFILFCIILQFVWFYYFILSTNLRFLTTNLRFLTTNLKFFMNSLKTIKYAELKSSQQILVNAMKSMGFVRLQFQDEFDFKNMHKACKEFFKLSQAQKNEIRKNQIDRFYFGYFPSSLNGKEGLDIPNPQLQYKHILANKIQFPKGYDTKYQSFLNEYFYFVHRIGLEIIQLLWADALKLFDDKKNLSMLRLNYYPKHEQNETAVEVSNQVKLACETHVDNTLITLLFQDDCGGLQVQNPSNKEWIDVQCIDNSLIVNTGKILGLVSNDAFVPVNHRVLFNEEERISVPYFMCPNIDSELNNGQKYEQFLLETMVKFKQYEHIGKMMQKLKIEKQGKILNQ